jgi:oligopeptidase B
MNSKPSVPAPAAPRRPHAIETHGDIRNDHYYWLNDRQDPAVIDYLQAENDYLDAMTAHTADFKDKLFHEMVARIKQEDQSVPYFMNDYHYRTAYQSGKEYPLYYRKKDDPTAVEELLLDVNALADGHTYYAVAGLSVSPDNQWLAFGEDTISRRIYTLRFKNIHTGDWLSEQIPGTAGNIVWAADSRCVFYTIRDEQTLRACRIMRHVIGTPHTDDVEIYHEADETFSTFVTKSTSKKYIIIGSSATVSDEYRVLEADTPFGEFRIIQARERLLEYNVDHIGTHFYIRTNHEATNFRLMHTPENTTGKYDWTELIPHRTDVLLEGVTLFEDFLILAERIHGIVHIRVKSRLDDSTDYYINFGEDSYVAMPGNNPEPSASFVRLGYTSMTTPATTFDYHFNEKKLELRKQEAVLGDFNRENYVSERLYATARDGARIPISLVYRKGFVKNGEAPLLLYAYGSYGYSMDPYFSSVRLSLLDRGFAYAIAHIRGGEEMGRHWYDQGRLLHKMNTFTDFIDCAEYLLQEKYTTTQQLFAMGGSAGGLLMGAVINQRPDLWKGVVAAVPFVDVVTTMLDDTIPLTTFEYDEWGNPNDPVYYHYMKAYSPYDNVKAMDYPAMLVTTGLHDSQVQYWEPAKWVAKLRELKTDDHPLFLWTNMATGHGGASGRFERYRETAMEYAFLLDLAGKIDPQ